MSLPLDNREMFPADDHAPLSRARLAGPTVRDLIDALRLLDPDTKTSITEVHVECEGGYRRLVPDGHDDEHVAEALKGGRG